jgi:hypothetical protein
MKLSLVIALGVFTYFTGIVRREEPPTKCSEFPANHATTFSPLAFEVKKADPRDAIRIQLDIKT